MNYALKKPRITVVTVCYNSGKTIEQTILSVIGQDYDNLEYIIIDGKSEDDTVTIIERYREKISVAISEKDDGIYFAMNKGVEYATGDLIAFLNSDDWYDENALQSVANAYMETDADVIYGDITYVEDGIYQREFVNNIDNMVYEMSIAHPAAFVKTSIMKSQHFNTKYRIAADYFFFAQLYYNKMKFVHVDKNLAFFRKGGKSTLNYYTAYEAHDIATSLAKSYECMPTDLLELDRRYYNKLFYYACLKNEIYNIPEVCRYLEKKIPKSGCYIFGYGTRGKRAINLFKAYGVIIQGIIDNNSVSIESRDYEILKPDAAALKKDSLIIVTPRFAANEVGQQLQEIGVDEKSIIDFCVFESAIGEIIHERICLKSQI